MSPHARYMLKRVQMLDVKWTANQMKPVSMESLERRSWHDCIHDCGEVFTLWGLYTAMTDRLLKEMQIWKGERPHGSYMRACRQSKQNTYILYRTRCSGAAFLKELRYFLFHDLRITCFTTVEVACSAKQITLLKCYAAVPLASVIHSALEDRAGQMSKWKWEWGSINAPVFFDFWIDCLNKHPERIKVFE